MNNNKCNVTRNHKSLFMIGPSIQYSYILTALLLEYSSQCLSIYLYIKKMGHTERDFESLVVKQMFAKDN